MTIGTKITVIIVLLRCSTKNVTIRISTVKSDLISETGYNMANIEMRERRGKPVLLKVSSNLVLLLNTESATMT